LKLTLLRAQPTLRLPDGLVIGRRHCLSFITRRQGWPFRDIFPQSAGGTWPR